jgi:hypothetical protein
MKFFTTPLILASANIVKDTIYDVGYLASLTIINSEFLKT